MVDIKPYVDELVADGMDATEATDTVTKIVETIINRLGEDKATDEFITSRIKYTINKSKGKAVGSMKCIVMGYDKGFDVNAKLRASAENLWKSNPQRAIQEGYVLTEEIDGELKPKLDEDGFPTYIDNREFVDKDGKMKNFALGKELKEYIKRTVVVLTEEDEIIRTEIYGEAPEIGKEYIVYGKKGNDGLFRGNKRGYKFSREVNANELWKRMFDACGSCDIAQSLTDLPMLEDWTIYLTYGTVKKVAETTNGSTLMVFVDENCPDGVTGFSQTDKDAVANRQFWNIQNVCERVVENAEALIVGKGRVKDDGQYTMNVLGVIQPFEAESQGDLQAELDEIFGVE